VPITTTSAASGAADAAPRHPSRLTPHLARLEAESIHIIREVAASFRKPVMLYSIGKDSGVMLHLAL
jgi:sulfate adenylyltransferase subunit 2